MKKVLILAGGCFWCTESVFKIVKGVVSLECGYIGGQSTFPNYKEICTGNSGHAEAIKVIYDSEIVSFEELLNVFFLSHDPTTLNRQGNDVGTQYRSAIFVDDQADRQFCLSFIEGIKSNYTTNIVTEVNVGHTFYPAEDYHQDYFNKNPFNSYCLFSIPPKLKKIEENCPNLLSK